MNQNPVGQVIINFNCGQSNQPQEEPQPQKKEPPPSMQKMPGQQPLSACGGSIRPGHQPLHCMVQSGAGKAYQPAITKNNRFPSSVLKPATPQEPGPGQPNNKLRRPPYYEDQKVGKLTLELPPASSGGRYNPVTI